MFDTGSIGGSGNGANGYNSDQNNKNKPHSFQKKKKSSKSGDNKDNYSVTATTSKAKTPLPPNQEKKVNNKRAAKRKREKLLEISRNSNKTPLSATSETRDMFDGMELNEESFDSSDSEAQMLVTATDEYKELPTDALILNTETVEKIIEKIATDIEESEGDDENEFNSDSDSDEFGDGEALNAGVKRYFIENSGPKCFNCGESGHVLKDCPASSTVPCNLCGQVGHTRFNCPQEVCYNCSRPGHQSKACPARRKRRVYDDDLCNRCGQPGHLARECSMAWRGYVFSRDLPRSHSTFLDELRGLRKRCYNCASISHFGDDCPNRRRPNYSVFHIPDYDYLDRVILRIKTSSSGHAKKEVPNAKQIQADNFRKIIENSGNKQSNKPSYQNKQNKNNQVHHHIKQQHQQHKQSVNDYEDDFAMFDDTDDNYKEHLSNAKSANRKVFLQSRGIVEEDQIKKPVPFVHYEANQVKVKKYEDEEEEGIKKGSSKKQQHRHYNKPSYRGGYK